MRQYKDSGIEWIGKIPEAWEIDIAKHVFRQRREKGNDVECQLLAATQKNGMYPQHLLEGVVKVAADTDLNMFKTIHKNDYVISLRSFQGGFEMSDYEGVCSPAYQVFFATRQIANQYYKYLFKSDAFIQEINSLTVGIREGKNIQYDDFALLPIPIPTVCDQQLIADYLDEKCGEIDSLIALQEQMIEKLKAYKQSVITEAVTKGLDPNAKLVPSGIDWIGDIPEGWLLSRVKFYGTIKSGEGISMEELNEDGEFPVWGGNGLMGYTNKFNQEKLSIIIGRVGALCGNVRLLEKPTFVSDNALIFELSRKIDAQFMLWLLTGANLNKLNTSNAQPLITGTKVKNVQIPVPPLSEQHSIASYLDSKCSDIDRLIALKQQKIESLKDYKKSVIYEAVTGKTEI